LDMINRIIPLLLFIGFVWGQTDFDKLVVKDGTTYFGEYSKIEGKIVFFKPQNAFTFQPIPVKRIRRLELKDEKAIYDAKSKGLGKWALYMPMSTMFFGGFAGLYYLMPIFSGGSSAASFYITYLVFNNNEKFNFPKSILTDSEKEIYEQAYSEKIRQRKFNYIIGSTIVAGGCALLIISSISISGFGDWGGLNCGPPCGGSIDVDYP